MNKFKVGDKCKLINDGELGNYEEKEGEIVTIVKINRPTGMDFTYQTNLGPWVVRETRLELVHEIEEVTKTYFKDKNGLLHDIKEEAIKSNKKIDLGIYFDSRDVDVDCSMRINCIYDFLDEHRAEFLKYYG